MKFFLLAFITTTTCLVLSWSQPTPMPESSLDDATKKCMAKENVDFSNINDFISGKMKIENVSGNFKCFIRCVVEDRGYLKDGQLNEEKVVKAAENITSVEQVRKIISGCKITKGSDVCDTSFKIYMCIASELK